MMESVTPTLFPAVLKFLVPQSIFSLLPVACLVATLLHASFCFTGVAAAQDAVAESSNETANAEPEMNTVSASQAKPNEPPDLSDDAPSAETSPELEPETEPEPPEPFQLPREQHAWAKFQPGAWRELQTITESFDATGKLVDRNVTTQIEVLQAVDEGKYVLQEQATVDLGGKRIVGAWKTRVLHIDTDTDGSVVESRRLEDQTLTLAGHTMACQLWELRYPDGAHNVMELLHYDPLTYPHVLRRERFIDHESASAPTKDEGKNIDTGESQEKAEQPTKSSTIISPAAEPEQVVELTALEVPTVYGEQLLDCSCLRAHRHRSKGDTMRLVFTNVAVPGGEVAVRVTEFDAEGRRVRWGVTQLLDYGETPRQGDSAPPKP